VSRDEGGREIASIKPTENVRRIGKKIRSRLRMGEGMSRRGPKEVKWRH